MALPPTACALSDGIPPSAPGGGSRQRGTKTTYLMPCRGAPLPAGNKGGAPPVVPGALCRWRTKAAYLRPRRGRAPVSVEQRRHTSCRAGGAPLPAANKGGAPPIAPGALCRWRTKAAYLRPCREGAPADGEQRRHTSGRTGRGLLSAGNKNGSAPHAVPGSASASGEQRRCTSDRAGSGLLSAGNKFSGTPPAVPGSASASGEQKRQRASCRAGERFAGREQKRRRDA